MSRNFGVPPQYPIPPRDPVYGLDNRYDTRHPKVWYLLHDWERTVFVPTGKYHYETEDGRRKKVELKEPVTVQVKEGFPWDSASIPKRFQDVFAKWGKHSNASLAHDWLYAHRIGTRARADLVFRCMLEEDLLYPSMGWFARLKAKASIRAMYYAVRIGGQRAWDTD